MQDKPFGEEFNEILYKFLLRPESPPSDTLRVASLYSGGRIHAAVKGLGLDVVWEHQPTDTRRPDFEQIPPIDFLVATVPDDQKAAIDYVLRYLRVRRPWVFLLVREDEDAGLLWRMQDETHQLGYVVNRTVQGGCSFLVGTLGQDLPDQTGGMGKGESLVGRLIRECAEREKGC